jgi:N-acetylmuramoyl-L-alanine amidase
MLSTPPTSWVRRGRTPPAIAVLAVMVLLPVAALLPGSGPAGGVSAGGVTAGHSTVPEDTGPAPGEPTSLHPMVGMATDQATGGYWLVASDGGVFSFNAPFYGSAGAIPLVRPVVGAASTPDGGGYWLVASDGGVFSFGDARFYGSTGGIVLNRPVVGMAAAPDGGGYWLVASDGGIFTFGDAPFRGSATGQLQRVAVGMAPAGGAGYRVISADGGVYDYGGAPDFGQAYVPPMAGEVISIDPGHDGGNASDPAYIDQPIDGGNFTETCDTVGTETADGYSEHAFNFDVASRLEALLAQQGAVVVMTRTNDTGVGPCVNVRAAIANNANAVAAISIHADGGPVTGRGFDVTEPVPVVSSISNNTAIVPASAQLAADIDSNFAAATGEPPSDYSGAGGIDERDNLGGLNLTTVPKVLIECANMQNPTDAALTESPEWRQQAAQGLADGITSFVEAQEAP